MMPLLEALKNAGQVSHDDKVPARLGYFKSGSARLVATLLLLAAVGVAGHYGLTVGTPAAVSLASAALIPAPPLVIAAEPSPVAAAATTPAPNAVPARDADRASETLPPPRSFHIGKAKPGIDPGLQGAYEAYMAGDLVAARVAYERVLASEARNSHALHGMAAINLRQEQPAAAEEYYLRALEADPKDVLAQSGLINLKGQGNPLQSESRLKSLLAAQPGLFALNFALGNLYAAQGRWSEAEQAYFKAVKSDPGNPDALFNLAVGLDQLHQSKLAANYYQRALAATTDRPAGFDPTQLQARLLELQ